MEQENKEGKKRDYVLPASILIAAALIAVALIYNAGKKTENPTALPTANSNGPTMSGKDIDLSAVAFLGKSDAPATLVEYGDYQCPFCAHFFADTEPKIKSDYIDTGKIKFAYKDMAFLGSESIAAAEAAACAEDQGKFWEFHDALFNAKVKDYVAGGSENDGVLNRTLFVGTAQSLGLNATDFASCIDSNKYKDKVQKSTAEAGAVMGADKASTPSFFLNGTLITPQGALPYVASGTQPYFKQILDQVVEARSN